MTDLHINHVRMCAPRGSHMPHMKPETHAEPRTLTAHDALKALSNKVISRTSARTLPAHGDSEGRTWPAHGPQPGQVNPDLVARVRQHFTIACDRLDLDPAPVLRQFDCWRYTEADLIEMDGWPTSTVMQHCLLLASEVAEGMQP